MNATNNSANQDLQNQPSENIETYNMSWSGVHFTMSWEANCFGWIISHIEIHTENKYPLPITSTGYKSLFLQKEEVMSEGWPVAYVKAWLKQEAGEQDLEQQGALF